MSSIRIATLDDIETLLKICHKFLLETPYKNVTPDPETTRVWLTALVQSETSVAILADEDSLVIGVTVQLPFSSEVVASEIMWGSLKNGFQRAKVEKQLLEAFEYWGRNVVKADIIQIGSFHGDKFLTRRGYARCETLYLARLT